MYNFSYDKKSDYLFDKEGYPIKRKDEELGIRRSYDSKKPDLKSACLDFLNKKDNGFLYDIDEDVVESVAGKTHEIITKQDWDGSWTIVVNGDAVTKHTMVE